MCVTWWVSKPPFTSELLSQWADIRLGVTNKASIVITLSHERTIHILHKQSFTIIDSQMYKILCNTQQWTVMFIQTNSCVMKRCLNSWCEIPLTSISAHFHWNLCISYSRFSLFHQLRVAFFCFCFVLFISLPFHWQMRSNRWTLWVNLLSGPQMSSVFVDSIHPSFLSICDMRANFKTMTGRLGSTGRKFVFCLGQTLVCCCTQLLVFSKMSEESQTFLK